MNATQIEVEVSATDAEMESQLEVVKELSMVELAYVGGGTAVVSFI
jgi:hypothetical protein